MVKGGLQEALSTPLVRQPIFDPHRRVFGYELLYPRHIKPEQYQALFDAKHATKRLLDHFASHFHAGELSRLPAFIAVSARHIRDSESLPIDADKVVLSVVRIDVLDDSLLSALSRLKRDGFELLFDIDDCLKEPQAIAGLADYVRFDVGQLDAVAIQQKLVAFDRDEALLLAGGVADYAKYESCQSLGFDLFQGAFYETPEIAHGSDHEDFKSRALSVLGYIYAPNADISVVARKISFDEELTEQLLAIINSAAYGLIRHIEKLHEAIVFLGFDQVKRWVTLIVFSEAGEAPPELLRTLLIRGRCCELYAMRKKLVAPDSFFTAGLFSRIDALMGDDLDFLIADLGLEADVGKAIAQFEGEVGAVLQAAIQLDHGAWDEISGDIDIAMLVRCYSDAIMWCEKVTAAIR